VLARNLTGQNRGGSTFAMAGRAQLSEEMVKRKQKERTNPLEVKRQWESRNEEKDSLDE
jgi:hypothetical protein